MSEKLPTERSVIVERGEANSHCFDDQILLGGECIAFSSEPWSSRIAASLEAMDRLEAARPTDAVERVARWLYTWTGGVGFDALRPDDKEHWLSHGRKLLAALTDTTKEG